MNMKKGLNLVIIIVFSYLISIILLQGIIVFFLFMLVIKLDTARVYIIYW